MTRKFLFCFPLRVGNIVFGYVIITMSLAVIVYNLYELGLNMVPRAENEKVEQKFDNWENLGVIFGNDKNTLVTIITMIYHLSYVIVGFMLFIFAAMLTCGAYKANHCLVTTFFVYSFVHLFLSIILVVWEATSSGWIQLGLILASDFLLIFCLFGVKYLMEAITSGNIYSRPGEVYYKY